MKKRIIVTICALFFVIGCNERQTLNVNPKLFDNLIAHRITKCPVVPYNPDKWINPAFKEWPHVEQKEWQKCVKLR